MIVSKHCFVRSHIGYIYFYLCLSLSFFSYESRSQNYQFGYLNIEAGLSQNSVLAIAQDKQGFMWLGTRHGLNRYDGRVIKVYQKTTDTSNDLPDDYILSILCDTKGTIWVGTIHGLCKYLPALDQFEPVPLLTTGKRNEPAIHCIYEDRKGNIWVGYSNGLRMLVENKKGKITLPTNIDTQTNIRCMYEDSDGQLWAGSDKGLLLVTRKNGSYRTDPYLQNGKAVPFLVNNPVTTIVEDAEHNLWIGTQKKGVLAYSKKNNTLSEKFNANTIPSINNNVRKILLDHQQMLWIGTQEGIVVYNTVTNNARTYQYTPADKKSLSQNSVYAIFEDSAHSIWVGTYYGGANVIYTYTNSFSAWRSGAGSRPINNNTISGFAEDPQHNLWVATEGGGLNYINYQTGVTSFYKNTLRDETSLASNLIKTIYLDPDNNLWVGTHGGGLNVLPARRKKFNRFLYTPAEAQSGNREITSILEDSQERFWVGASDGLLSFRRTGTMLKPTGFVLPDRLKTASVKAIIEDSKKNIWIGTNNGVFLLKQSKNHFIFIEALRKINVNCLLDDNQGNIWIGSYYNGLIAYNPVLQTNMHFTEKQGLPNNNILSIKRDNNNNLWIGTGNGLAKFGLKSKYFQNFTVSDGLACNEFNNNAAYIMSNGQFLFGGLDGFTSFLPLSIRDNKYRAPIVFTSLKIFNKIVAVNAKDGPLQQNINLTNKIVLRHDQDVFTIDFALLNYIKPDKNRYAYQLHGLDKNWIETNTPSITYTHLPAGKYNLLVKGANNDGLWSTNPVSMEILVLPPFWRTSWAYVFYAVTLMLIMFLITRYYFLKKLLKKENELHQSKLNFFTNISHEIRTHLTLIMAPVEKLLRNSKDDFVQLQGNNIKNNTNRLLRLVAELMDFRKAETNHLQLRVNQQDLIRFLADIYESFKELAEKKNIHFNFQHTSQELLLYFDKDQLEKVFFNLTMNAFKFTPDGGTIDIMVEQTPGAVLVTIQDNGVGIAEEHVKNIFTNFFQVADYGAQNTGYGIGLALSKTLIDLHKGNIAIETGTNTNGTRSGSRFIVTLLMGHQHFGNINNGAPVDTQPKSTTTILPADIKNLPVAGLFTVDEALKDDSELNTILIVEDNQELRTLLKESLNTSYIIYEAANGKEGWDTVTELIPDLIISDIMMPEMDGIDLCYRIKTDERTSHIPVILLTAKSAESDHLTGLKTGADAYITKPFSNQVLELTIRNLLALRNKMRKRFSKLVTEVPLQKNVKDMHKPEKDLSYDNQADVIFLDKILMMINEHLYDPDFSALALAEKAKMSHAVLYKKLKAITGQSLNDIIKSCRLKKATLLLQEGTMSVANISFTVGYSDRRYFTREFKKQFGVTPSEYIAFNSLLPPDITHTKNTDD